MVKRNKRFKRNMYIIILSITSIGIFVLAQLALISFGKPIKKIDFYTYSKKAYVAAVNMNIIDEVCKNMETRF